MTSPDDQDPVRSKLDYAPPWVREQAVREQAAREQATREQVAHEPMPREPITRDQFRAALRQSGGPAVEQAAQNDRENRRFGDDRPWHQRALEPEPVPEPPAGVSNVWPMMLRLGVVCTIAAMVAAALVFLFSPKQNAHKIAQADASAPASVSDDAAPAAIELSRRGVPALTVETSAGGTSAGGTTPLAPGQVAIATPAAGLAAATPPQLAEGQLSPRRRQNRKRQPRPRSQAQQIASLPAPNSSPANIKLITGTGRERADTAPGRRQSGGNRPELRNKSGVSARPPSRSGPSRSAERRQARSRARRK